MPRRAPRSSKKGIFSFLQVLARPNIPLPVALLAIYPLVPLELGPGDVALMLVLEQHVPLGQWAAHAERRGGRGWAKHRAVRGEGRRPSGRAVGGAAGGILPPASRQTGRHPHGRTRPLGIPTVKDRIVQQAVRLVDRTDFRNAVPRRELRLPDRERGSHDALPSDRQLDCEVGNRPPNLGLSLTQPRQDSPAPTRRDYGPLASLRRAPRPRGRAAAKPGRAKRGWQQTLCSL